MATPIKSALKSEGVKFSPDVKPKDDKPKAASTSNSIKKYSFPYKQAPLKRYTSSSNLQKEIHKIFQEKTKKDHNKLDINEEQAHIRFQELRDEYLPSNSLKNAFFAYFHLVTKDNIQRRIVDHVEYTLARDRVQFDKPTAYQSTAYSVRDQLIEKWNDTNL
jgi:hypothetical protein